jgi:hypothetical protein
MCMWIIEVRGTPSTFYFNESYQLQVDSQEYYEYYTM